MGSWQQKPTIYLVGWLRGLRRTVATCVVRKGTRVRIPYLLPNNGGRCWVGWRLVLNARVLLVAAGVRLLRPLPMENRMKAWLKDLLPETKRAWIVVVLTLFTMAIFSMAGYLIHTEFVR